jgi:hypothetical protein
MVVHFARQVDSQVSKLCQDQFLSGRPNRAHVIVMQFQGVVRVGRVRVGIDHAWIPKT